MDRPHRAGSDRPGTIRPPLTPEASHGAASCAVPAGGVGGIRGVRRRWRRAAIGLALLLIPTGIGDPAPAGEPPRANEADLKLGQELFTRQWRPNDPRCHGGDGLGPVYNATSCVACHGQGGAGGAGPVGDERRDHQRGWRHHRGLPRQARAEDSLRELTWSSRRGPDPRIRPARGVVLGRGAGRATDVYLATDDFHLSTSDTFGRFRNGFVVSADGKTLKAREFDVKPSPDGDGLVLSCPEGSLKARSFALKPDEDDLIKLHPGLLTASSAVIHRFGVDPAYAEWRSRLKAGLPNPRSRSDRHLGVISGGRIVTSERNAPPLFGLGLIDALPGEVLVATAAQQSPLVRGRVNRMTSGQIGKFGWKAQTTDLREFVLAACANELGLEVPGHGQAISPLNPDARAKAPDLTPEECDALVAYVEALPAPIQLEEPDPRVIEAGRASFEEIGCTDCHRPSLGTIEGIYSDLLLHDMGPDLFSFTGYYATERMDIPTAAGLADGSQWRTPPLWGYCGSGPYLHDGRARNLQDVIKAHKGQALESAMRFSRLSPQRRSEIEQFLKSLTATPSGSSAVMATAKDPSTRRRSLLGPPASPPPAQQSPAPRRADAVVRVE